MDGDNSDVLDLIRKAIEIGMPDFRHYYRITKKARIVAVSPSDGSYFVDVQPLRNDETDDPKEPVIPKVALPVLWGGPDRGVVCPPMVGVLCDLSYYDGDPNYPFISNVRWGLGMKAPRAELNEFVIQLENGVELRIDKEKNMVSLTPANWKVEIGGDANIKAGGNAEITASGNITLTAPSIFQNGNVTTGGTAGATGTVTEHANRTQTGTLTLNGPFVINGDISVSGSSSVSGNSHAGSRSGGEI